MAKGPEVTIDTGRGLLAEARFVSSPNQDARPPGATIDLSEEIRPWWRRSPPLAAGAALAIGLATLWFANMLGRVPLDSNSTFGYLLMLPLLLVVPAFSAAGPILPIEIAASHRTVSRGS